MVFRCIENKEPPLRIAIVYFPGTEVRQPPFHPFLVLRHIALASDQALNNPPNTYQT